MLLQGLHQTDILSVYYRLIDIISNWVANPLQVYKDSNQVIPWLKGMVFTGLTKDSIDK